jgi:esterase/lipase
MIEFKYNKKIDERCWKRIIQTKEMFGHKFPSSFNITQKDINKAKKQIKYFQRIWKKNEKEFYKGIKKIYRYHFPKKMICYINTSPYSMDDYEKGYISISMYRDTPEKIVSTIIHEASHFMFRKHYTDFCYSINCNQNDIENIKEIVTVINNTEFKNVRDYGWKIHQRIRKKTKKIWQETHDIKKVIKEIKNNLY